jgi:hypothetical protein
LDRCPEPVATNGPTVALRLEMRLYRWCITFGALVLDWEDL